MLNLIIVFEGSFGGATLYENPNYITPNAVSKVYGNRMQDLINTRKLAGILHDVQYLFDQ